MISGRQGFRHQLRYLIEKSGLSSFLNELRFFGRSRLLCQFSGPAVDSQFLREEIQERMQTDSLRVGFESFLNRCGNARSRWRCWSLIIDGRFRLRHKQSMTTTTAAASTTALLACCPFGSFVVGAPGFTAVAETETAATAPSAAL